MGTYTLTFTGKGNYAGTATATIKVIQGLSGSGTEADPYVITTLDNWNLFAQTISEGNDYSGEYVQMKENIDNVTTMVGDQSHRFKGTFDGNGKTLGVNLTATEECSGPFRAIENATIKDLTVTGTFSSTAGVMGGIAGGAWGTTTFENCESSVAFISTKDGDGTDGGFVGNGAASSLTFKHCVFSGSFTGEKTHSFGGFVGWRQDAAKVYIDDCLNSATSLTLIDNYCATFTRHGSTSITNSYYLHQWSGNNSSNEGKQVYTTQQDGSINKVLSLFGTTYYLPNAVSVSGIKDIYEYTGADITVGYALKDGNTTLTNGTDYTLTITNSKGETVETTKEPDTYTFTFTGKGNTYIGTTTATTNIVKPLSGEGTIEKPYLISTLDNWNTFAKYVSYDTDYSGKYVKLGADIEGITTMVGDKDHRFKGTLDGDGKTITVNLQSSQNGCAPFYAFENATIRNLNIAGTISTTGLYGAGLAVYTYGSTTISNCHITVSLTGNNINNRYYSLNGGFVSQNQNGAKLSFNKCSFIGELLGNGDANGGFVGVAQSSIIYTDCIFAPTKLTINTDNSYTFNRNGNNTFVRTYYTQILGTRQGTAQVYTSVQTGSINKVLTPYKTSYYLPNAVSVSGINATYDYTGSDITMGYTLKEGDTELKKDSDYILTITTEAGDTVPAMKELGTYTLTFTGTGNYAGATTASTEVVKNLSGEGTVEKPYLISTLDDWNLFADNVTKGADYSNKTVKLAKSIEGVTNTVGSSDKPFKGTFYGANNTLKVNINGTDEKVAPFKYVAGATIKNLKVEGSVESSANHTSGLVGCLSGNVTIDSVEVAATVNNTSGGYAGGFIGHAQTYTVTITNSAFTGTLTASQNGAYFVGWGERSSKANVSNSLANPASTPTAGNIWDFVCTKQITNKAVTNCYYTAAGAKVNSGENQGTLVYTEVQAGSMNKVLTFFDNKYYLPNAVTVSGIMSGYEYTGKNIEINYAVKDGDKVLTKDTDYEVSITDVSGKAVTAVNALGTYTYTFAGKGNYVDTTKIITKVEKPITGTGTADDPYIISSTANWNTFASLVTGGKDYSGEYVQLSEDFDNSLEPIAIIAGDGSHNFKGTFDGKGRTLTLNLNATTNGCAPFYSLENATIKNLNTAGSITARAKFGASIAAYTNGTVKIDSCHSTVSITSDLWGDGTHGGFVGVNQNTLNISNASFEGKLLGSDANSNGGFVGWTNGNITYTDCVFAPTEVTMTGDGTFNRNGKNTFTRAYYTRTFGSTQGTAQVYTTRQDGINRVITPYKTSYYLPNAVSINGINTMYDYTGDTIHVAYSVKEGDTELKKDTDYILTITTAAGDTVQTMNAADTYTLTFTGMGTYVGTNTFTVKVVQQLSGTGTAEDPYVISTLDDWNIFAARLADGINYSGKIVKLKNSIEGITAPAGDTDHPFKGTFDGNGDTLTIALTSSSSSDENLAPFRKVVDATIKNLTTAGTITTDASCAAGIIGRSEGTVNLDSCLSAVAITTSKSGDNTSGGLMASCSGTLTFTDCAFTGSITGSNAECCGGFVGWRSDGTLNVVHCLNAGKLNIKSTGESATFARNGVSSITDSYYLNKVDKTVWNQGSQVFTTALEGVTNKEITFLGTTYYLPTLSGNGTAEDPYIIYNLAQWNFFASTVSGGNDYSGKTVKLGNSISGITTRAGDSDHRFRGTFEGSGDTITLAMTITEYYYAPFGALDGATIQNLNIAGTLIFNSKHINYCSGLAAKTYGTTTISNCHSTVSISSVDYNLNNCAFVGENNGKLVFSNCSFKGELLGDQCTSGGFVGWNKDNGEISFSDCLFAPTKLTMYDYGGYVSGTFARYNSRAKLTFTRCYYTRAWGTVQGTHVYTSNDFTNKEIVLFGTSYYLPASIGSGTEDDPYTISSVADWNAFGLLLADGTDYHGKYVKMTKNIEGVTKTVGESGHPFPGTFDGDGHKMTINITAPAYANSNDENKGWGPFRFTDGATIKNLWTAGTITCPDGDGDLSIGGIVGRTIGSAITTLSNCRSNVVIDMSAETSSNPRDFTAGGLVGCTHQQGVVIENCLFDGELKGEKAKCNGGFIGWATNAATIRNSVQAGTFSTNTSDCGTFARNSESQVTLDNCYYLNNYNDGSTTSSINYLSGTPTQITADNVAACTAKLPEDYWYYEDGFTYPMLGRAIRAISNINEWDAFALSVTNGRTYKGMTVTLKEDIDSITTMAGDDNNAFKGIFDGGNKTLTLALQSTSENDKNLAPFRKVVDGSIKNLRMVGTITTSAPCAAGIIGRSEGTVTLDSCLSSVAITTSWSGDNTTGGLVSSSTGNITFTDCAFTGTITGTNAECCAGFVGWRDDAGTANIKHCLDAGTLNIRSTSESATFARHGVNGTLSEAYYLNRVDRQDYNEGLQVYTTEQEGCNNQTVEFFGTTYYLPTLTGTGTAADPYLIKNVAEWNTFAQSVVNGTDYNGKLVKLEANIDDVTTMAGTATRPFKGTFDGNGKKITVNYSIRSTTNDDKTTRRWGVFRSLNGATIKNLRTAGTITFANGGTRNNYTITGGIAGYNSGKSSTLSNCRSSITFDMSAQTSNRDFTSGGLVGAVDDGVVIENCLVDGYFKGSHAINCGGFIGWTNAAITISNSVQAAAFAANTSGAGTFARNAATFVSLSNCYYLTDFSTTEHNTYKSGTPTQLTDANMASEAAKLPADYWMYEQDLDYPQLKLFAPEKVEAIASVDDWNTFATSVADGRSYKGATVTMDADVSDVETMTGTEPRHFKGTFDGKGKTLTVNISDETAQGTAPFRYINGATIKNLKVEGEVNSGSQSHSSGLVGFAWDGTNTIDNCWVSTDVNCSEYHGGVIGHAKNATVIIRNTIYDGILQTTDKYVGGFQGWGDGNTLTIENSLFAGTCTAEKFHPLGTYWVNGATTQTINNVLYTATPTLTAADNVAKIISGGEQITADELKTAAIAAKLQGEQETEMWIIDPTNEQGTTLKTFAAAAQTTMSKALWGTYYNSLAWRVPEGMTAYTVSVVGDASVEAAGQPVKYAEKDVVPAGTAVLLHAQPGNYTLMFERDDNQTAPADNCLFGSDLKISANEAGYSYYQFSYGHSNTDNANVLGFWMQQGTGGKSISLPGHKAYLRTTEGTGANGFTFYEDGNADDITNIDANGDNDDTPAYNLQGVRVSKGYHGVVIKNGKKRTQK